MSQITPFVKRMRTQGGTFYTFSSAVEDIGLNINERNNVVKMSHFAMLDLPAITAPDNLEQNTFNLLAISGSLDQYEKQNSIKDGTVLVAESFQNYALNLETNLLSQADYNPALLRSVSERVFWKWLKETGAVRWTKDTSNNGYWIEPIDTDSSLGYNSVVKYVGEISAGSVRTDTYGTYNETYVLVPTSHGQTRVYFKQDYDDNYKAGMEIGPGPATILGQQNYTKPHPDGLSYQAFYDAAYDVSTSISGWTIEVSTGDSTGYNPGSWWSAQGQIIPDDNYYFTDVSTLLDSSIYDYDIKFTGSGDFEFRRSNVDALSIEFNLNNLRNIFGDPELTFDKMAIEDSVDDSFNFNAILVYYTVYNQTLDKVLATNLLGILFLDRAAGNTSGFPDMEIEIPQITKLQSNGTGFGTSYSFRINIKSDNMFDDTQAVIYDESTSSQTALTSWTDVFASLEKSLSIMNSNSQYLQYITEQYIDISSTQTQQGNLLADLQYQVNDLVGDVKGTNNTIAMFQDGDDPLIDSSIYMDEGKIGIFNPEPSYGFQVDTSLSKFMNIMIQNAIVDTSQNIILGYGSPLQIGASTYQRGVNVYDGDASAAISVLNNKINVKSNSINFESSTFTVDTPNFTVDGSLTITGTTNIAGSVDIAGYIRDGSLSGPDFTWDSGFLFLNTEGIDGGIITDNSLGSQFFWLNGELAVTGGGSGASFLSQLLDVSIVGTPNDGSILSYNSALSYWMPTSIQTTLEGLSDTSISGSTNGQFITYNSGEWENTAGISYREWGSLNGYYLSIGDQLQISTDSLLSLSRASDEVEMRFSRSDLDKNWTVGFGCPDTLNEENYYIHFLDSGGPGSKTYAEIDPNTKRFYTYGEFRPESLRIDGSVRFIASSGEDYLYFDYANGLLYLGDYQASGDGLIVEIDGRFGKYDVWSDADGSLFSIRGNGIRSFVDLDVEGHIEVVDVSVTNNLSINNVPIGVPDTSQYVLFVREDEGNKLKRTLIWDASYLAFVDNAPNALVTAQSPNSIQGEANLTFDGNVLEFDSAANKTIRMKDIASPDATPQSLSILGQKGFGNVVIGTTTSFTFGTTYTTSLAQGYGGGDINIKAGAGADGMAPSTTVYALPYYKTVGGTGGDLILSAGDGGIGASDGENPPTNGPKGDVTLEGNLINLITNAFVFVGTGSASDEARIAHAGDLNTYIQLDNDVIRTFAGSGNDTLALSTVGAVFNEDGLSSFDFRVESDAISDMLFVDAGNNKVKVDGHDVITAGYSEVSDSASAASDTEVSIWTSSGISHADYIRNLDKKIYRIKFGYRITAAFSSNQYILRVRKGTTEIYNDTWSPGSSSELGEYEISVGATSTTVSTIWSKKTESGQNPVMTYATSQSHGTGNEISVSIECDDSSYSFITYQTSLEIIDS